MELALDMRGCGLDEDVEFWAVVQGMSMSPSDVDDMGVLRLGQALVVLDLRRQE